VNARVRSVVSLLAVPIVIAGSGSTLVLLAGCGNSRTTVPSLSAPVSPGVLRWVSYPAYGVTIRAPKNWAVSGGRRPLVTTISLSSSVAAVWSYPRHGGPPASLAALGRFRRGLIDSARRRDPSLQLIRSTVALVDGFPSVEVDALEHVGGRLRRARSIHVFTRSSEIVLDEYAPAALFHTVDHAVFSPLKRSLRIAPAASG
jgi:hypothetical protein